MGKSISSYNEQHLRTIAESAMNNPYFLELYEQEKGKEYFCSLLETIDKAYRDNTIFPPKKLVFNAFEKIGCAGTKVCIVGQDPYHQEGQAMGLSFSVPPTVPTPKSLKNIYKELESDLGIKQSPTGDLTRWAKQGVFLLNATLTVEKNCPGSHAKLGWNVFTDNVIKFLNKKNSPIVFILWGKHAQQKGRLVTNRRHLIIESAHPSPLSCYRGFFNSKPFSTTNKFLKENALSPIKW